MRSLVIALVAGCAALLCAVVAAQAPAAFDASYSPPRLASGKPDLQGLWSNALVTPLERPADLAEKEFLTADEARELWSQAAGIQVVDAPDPGDGDSHRRSYPTPQDADGADVTLIGRVREDPFVANGLSFWCIADNLRKGAALNAVQIAEELIRRGMV